MVQQYTEEVFAMLIRIKYEKQGALRFVGHLDLMRTFQKIFRRAGIPIAYSEGFNPHQIFSIAAPLSLGVASEGEYLDLKLREEMPLQQLMNNINSVCPEGIAIKDAVVLGDKDKAGMAAVQMASYKIDGAIDALDLEGFLSKESIVIMKKTKKGRMKELDLKPGIFIIEQSDQNLYMEIATGSTLNIKPEMVIEQLCLHSGIEYLRHNYMFTRVDLFKSISPKENLIGK